MDNDILQTPVPEEARKDEEQAYLARMRHSTAHLMAGAVLDLIPEAKLGIGPAIEDGFYYDFDLPRPLSQDELDAYLHRLEEAERRDHRKLGRELDLFSIHEEAGPGLIYWHPKGGLMRVLIENVWREEHLKHGYDIVFSPHIGKSWLWETSGHLGFYRENMYDPMDVDGQEYFIKPMNCPFHIMMYKTKRRSYRELPLRWAELGTVYRYERSGVLHGLLRVRGFTQDDAHIFCRPDQVEDEIRRVLDFTLHMLGIFGFHDFEVYLSTRPDKFVGEAETWDMAQDALRRALEAKPLAYKVDEGGGAFYGPKIDLIIKHSRVRTWQCT